MERHSEGWSSCCGRAVVRWLAPCGSCAGLLCLAALNVPACVADGSAMSEHTRASLSAYGVARLPCRPAVGLLGGRTLRHNCFQVSLMSARYYKLKGANRRELALAIKFTPHMQTKPESEARMNLVQKQCHKYTNLLTQPGRWRVNRYNVGRSLGVEETTTVTSSPGTFAPKTTSSLRKCIKKGGAREISTQSENFEGP